MSGQGCLKALFEACLRDPRCRVLDPAVMAIIHVVDDINTTVQTYIICGQRTIDKGCLHPGNSTNQCFNRLMMSSLQRTDPVPSIVLESRLFKTHNSSFRFIIQMYTSGYGPPPPSATKVTYTEWLKEPLDVDEVIYL